MGCLELFPITSAEGLTWSVEADEDLDLGGKEDNDVLNELWHLEKFGPSEGRRVSGCAQGQDTAAQCGLRTSNISIAC